jgi:beta-galactosidase
MVHPRNCFLALVFGASALFADDWKPAENRMLTEWGAKVTPANAWTEHPRPSLVRDSWQSLNGLWDFDITKSGSDTSVAHGSVLVPFCVEAALSGVGRPLEPDEVLTYRRKFEPAAKPAARTLLHFEAADYDATVWVNDMQVGTHRGGNTPFTFEITSALKPGANELKVRITDATDSAGSSQLRGKQTLKPKGIRYTRVSGLWQTVWLEEVPARYFADVRVTTRIKPGVIVVDATIDGSAQPGETRRVIASLNGHVVAQATNAGRVEVAIPDAQLWSPAHPNLYDLDVRLLAADGRVVDRVKSYAGLREVGTTRDAEGNLRFTLNGEVIFHWGPLDQGWWPDGLLTPPSDEAMAWDIHFLKDAGFNMLRKHVKVEPRRYYYHCDRIGMLVWQDQPSGGADPKWTRMAPGPTDAVWTDEQHEQWMREYREMVDSLRHHPSIVVWVPFNERWGQHRTMEVGRAAVAYDPTRLVNIASGGNFWPVGHIADHHNYPDPAFPLEDARFKDFVKVVGEFGGHGWPEPGHLWSGDETKYKLYGNRPKSREEWLGRYTRTIGMLADLKAKGIAAGVYTQTTDVEDEINGLVTYDRRVSKASVQTLLELSRQLGEEIRR